jgi:hypothetical protein
MELLAALLDAPVLEAPFPPPDPHPADAIRLALRVSDASDAVLPDAAEDAIVPALAVVRYAEKLAVPAQVAQAQAAKARPLPALAMALCIRDAVPSAA